MVFNVKVKLSKDMDIVFYTDLKDYVTTRCRFLVATTQNARHQFPDFILELMRTTNFTTLQAVDTQRTCDDLLFTSGFSKVTPK